MESPGSPCRSVADPCRTAAAEQPRTPQADHVPVPAAEGVAPRSGFQEEAPARASGDHGDDGAGPAPSRGVEINLGKKAGGGERPAGLDQSRASTICPARNGRLRRTSSSASPPGGSTRTPSSRNFGAMGGVGASVDGAGTGATTTARTITPSSSPERRVLRCVPMLTLRAGRLGGSKPPVHWFDDGRTQGSLPARTRQPTLQASQVFGSTCRAGCVMLVSGGGQAARGPPPAQFGSSLDGGLARGRQTVSREERPSRSVGPLTERKVNP